MATAKIAKSKKTATPTITPTPVVTKTPEQMFEALATPAVKTPEQKLAEMLQTPEQVKATIEQTIKDLTPVKKIATSARASKFTMVAFGGLISFPVKTSTAVDVDTIARHMYHGSVPVMAFDEQGQPIMEDVLDADSKPTGEKKHKQAMEDVLDAAGKPTGEKKPKFKMCLGAMKRSSMKCDCCMVDVDAANIVKGVEVGGKIVLVSDDEMKAQQPMNEKTMKLESFVNLSEINPIYFEDSEFVMPDTGGDAAFSLLVNGMARQGGAAKGVRVKAGREQWFVVAPYGQNGMIMHYLRAEYEVRDASGLWKPTTPDPAMVEMVASLIEKNTKPFAAAKADTYLDNGRKLIANKLIGVEIAAPAPEPTVNPMTDLKAALEAALRASAVA